jgi:hypothetical protein
MPSCKVINHRAEQVRAPPMRRTLWCVLGAALRATAASEAQMADDDSERRMNLLIHRLPASFQKPARWLRQPSSRWVRIPVGILLIIGSFLSILPVFGLWMLPLGMVMLAQDVPFIKRLIDRLLAWIEWKHPKWLGLPAG